MIEDPLNRFWPFAAALAGAWVALSLERFRTLPIGQKLTVLAGGFLGTIFVGPLVIAYYWPSESPDSRFIGGFYFTLALAFMSILPAIVETVSDRVSKVILALSGRGAQK